ncbi:MAG: histidinol-phosphate transaminase [Chloroflexota bacterium]
MSTSTPVSQVYTWEPSNQWIAERYGLRPSDVIRFDLNTSPTAPAFLAEALAGPFDPPLNEYPDSLYGDLAQAAADYVGADRYDILVGAGADEVLDIIAKTFIPPGGRAIIPIPTYSMYGVLTNQRSATIDAIPRRAPADGFGADLDTIIPRLPGTDVVWLCAPNNPTGAPEPLEGIVRVLDAAAALGAKAPTIVVDEAYFEFTRQTTVPLREQYPHLVTVRTLSKAFALPAMRVGYAIASRPTVEKLERNRPPGSIATVSAAVAAYALRHPELADAMVARVGPEREWLREQLDAAGWTTYPSVTNFVLARVGTPEEAEDATEWLLRHGIVSRTFGPANPLRGHLRFTVRTREDDEKLVAAARAWQERRRA